MKLTVVAILCFTMLCFFALGTFFVLKWFERNDGIIDEDLEELFELLTEKNNKTFSHIFIQSNGTVSPGGMSHKTYKL